MLIEGDNFRMIISVPQFGENPAAVPVIKPREATSEQDAPHVTPHVTPHVKRLLQVVKGEMSRQELMDALDLTDRMHFSKEYLRSALNDELMEMTLPDKPRSVSQKYRLTDKGHALLKEIES